MCPHERNSHRVLTTTRARTLVHIHGMGPGDPCPALLMSGTHGCNSYLDLL